MSGEFVVRERKGIMKVPRFLVVVVMCALLLAAPSSVFADDGSDHGKRGDREGKYVGSVSVTIRSDQSNKGDGPIVPSSTQPMPGGGYAWAQAQLAWTWLRMDGIAKTGLSSGVTGQFNLCARVLELTRDSVGMGGTVLNCGPRTGADRFDKPKRCMAFHIGTRGS